MKQTISYKLTVFFMLLAAVLFWQGETTAFAAAAFESTSVTLYLGDEDRLTKTLSVSGVTEGDTLRFTSADKTIAKVTSRTGKVTAVAAGKTTITCTITAADGTKSSCKMNVYVRDNISKLQMTLADTTIKENALKKHTGYELALKITTVAGTNENTGNYLFYEVVNAKGKTTSYAAVTDGVFTATRIGTYTVRVYAFQSSGYYKKWAADREGRADYVLASDELVLTVTLKNFKTTKAEYDGWNIVLPEAYELRVANQKDLTLFSINMKNAEGLTAASNIQVRIDTMETEPDFSELKFSIEAAYTKSLIAESWKAAYQAKNVYVKNLKREELTINGRSVMKISYDLVLKNVTLDVENAADIKISRLEYFNTVYTWYDQMEHITVNVTDAYEHIQPNITEAAAKMVESFTR